MGHLRYERHQMQRGEKLKPLLLASLLLCLVSLPTWHFMRGRPRCETMSYFRYSKREIFQCACQVLMQWIRIYHCCFCTVHPACKVHGCPCIFGCEANFWQNGMDRLLVKVTRFKIIPLLRSNFVGQNRRSYIRDTEVCKIIHACSNFRGTVAANWLLSATA